MLRLPSLEAAWVELAPGVSVLNRPAQPHEVPAATAWAQGRAAAVAERQREAIRERLGMEPGDDGELVTRLEWGFFVIALGRLCVTDWRGVADHAGETLPCTPDHVEALLNIPHLAGRYADAAMSLVAALRAEGNGSAPALNGTTAGALDIAGPASIQGDGAATA